jgi:hypothetical protein
MELSFEDSLFKRQLESEYYFSFDSCSKDDLIQIILQSARKSKQLDSVLKDALLNFKSVEFEVKIPEQPKPKLGLFTNLLIQHLEATDSVVYKQGIPFRTSDIATEIKSESNEGVEWINYLLSNCIQFLSDNQLRQFDDSDRSLVNTILQSKEISIYTATKVLKQMVDRLSSKAYCGGVSIDNNLFLSEGSFVALLDAILDLTY